MLDEEEAHDTGKSEYSEASKHSPTAQKPVSIRVEPSDSQDNGCFLSIPKVAASSSSETLTGNYIILYFFQIHAKHNFFLITHSQMQP